MLYVKVVLLIRNYIVVALSVVYLHHQKLHCNCSHEKIDVAHHHEANTANRNRGMTRRLLYIEHLLRSQNQYIK